MNAAMTAEAARLAREFDRGTYLASDIIDAATLLAQVAEFGVVTVGTNTAPIDMVLHCPACDEQIDALIVKPLDALLDHIYEYGTASEGTRHLARKIARAMSPPAPAAQSEPLTDSLIDEHLETILRAAGTSLRHYSIEKSKDDMRAALKAVLAIHRR